MTIRLVLAEDQSMLRGALSALLDLEKDLEVVASADNGDQALALVEEHQPDVLVTDIEMPGLTGIEVAEKLQGVTGAPRIVIVTTFARPGYLQRAREAGVAGYLLKDRPSEELADAIRKVAAGQSAIDPELAARAWTSNDPLSDRERQILRLVEAGKTNKQISSELNLSSGTVRNYLAEAAQKLDASNRIEAFQIARERGWL